MGLDRRSIAGGITVVATTVATFLPWGGSGDRVRSSYELVDVADRAGVVPDSAGDWAGVWFTVPVLAGFALLASAMLRPRLAGVLTCILGVLVTTGGLLVTTSPLVTQPAAIVAAACGVSSVGVGVWLVLAAHDEGGDTDERPMGTGTD